MSAAVQGNSRATGAAALLLLLLLLAGGGALAGISVVETKRLELDALQTQLDNLTRRRPPSPSSDAEAKISVQPFLAEESFALAANALQRRVVGLIEESEGKLLTVGVDPPITGDEELARRVSVQVTAELTNEALQKVLYELEKSVPFVFVDTFGVSRKQTGDGDETAEAQGEPPLSVSLSVTGYRRKGSQ
jgi:hypothetical protein